jgi:predicted MFS family arabinose efflux permease
MVKSIIHLYRQSYSGLSTHAWMLALVMLINRGGAMVMPFLSIYLTKSLEFDIKQAGICMGAYGAGSILGGFLGGYLTDKFGHFRVQFFSLITGGICFALLGLVEDYTLLIISLFIASIIIECVRPANTSSIALYAKPENITRAFSLNRMAINLGFSVGPAIGGLLAAINFKYIFFANAIASISAGIVFYWYFVNIKINPDRKAALAKQTHDSAPSNGISPWKNRPYLLFIILTSLFGIIFFQLFTSLPLFYKKVVNISEAGIGLLLALNGMIVFVFEMIFVYKYGQRERYRSLILTGLLVCGLAYILLNLSWVPLIVLAIISMILLSVGEILVMPFIASVAAEASYDQYRGAYMGLFTVAYSIAFALAPLIGTQLIAGIGFGGLWYFMAIFALFTGFAFFKLLPKVRLRAL